MVEYSNIFYDLFGRTRFIVRFKAITHVLEVFLDVLTGETLNNFFFFCVITEKIISHLFFYLSSYQIFNIDDMSSSNVKSHDIMVRLSLRAILQALYYRSAHYL